MFNNEQKIRKISAKLSGEQITHIKHFIKGAVYSFCANNLAAEQDGTSQWFGVSLLFGGKNYYWKEPLIELYDYYINAGKSSDTAKNMAGRDVGHLLKQVLQEDDRTYDIENKQRRFSTKMYKCINFNDK